MTERVEHLAEGVSLYLGDCREILPTLGKVGAVITDPPYGIGYAKYESHEDCPEDYPLLIGLSVDEAERHLEDGWMCVFQSAKTAPEWHKWFRRPYRPIALPKTFVQMPNVGPSPPLIGASSGKDLGPLGKGIIYLTPIRKTVRA